MWLSAVAEVSEPPRMAWKMSGSLSRKGTAEQFIRILLTQYPVSYGSREHLFVSLLVKKFILPHLQRRRAKLLQRQCQQRAPYQVIKYVLVLRPRFDSPASDAQAEGPELQQLFFWQQQDELK